MNYGQPSTAAKEQHFSYSIKIIPKKKTDYSIQRLRGITVIYKSVEDLKKEVLSACNGKISLESFGYIEPGHGAKGKQRWLTSIDDLKDMYGVHKGKTEILLWSSHLEVQRKRAHSPDADENGKRARYDKYLDSMTEVQLIEEDLIERHPDGQYTDEQLRSWAHLIQMKKHSSYDTPPNKRFWNKSVKNKGLTPSESGSSTSINVSPGKRVNLRGQCVQQLLQLHELLEKGGISKEQYDEMQSTIMGDVKKFD